MVTGASLALMVIIAGEFLHPLIFINDPVNNSVYNSGLNSISLNSPRSISFIGKIWHMEQIILIAVFSALILFLGAGGWILAKQKTNLDRAYHDALHEESAGHYAAATELYQSILDRATPFIIDNQIRSQISRRMKTLRHQQDYLSQFGKTAEAQLMT